MPAPPTSEIEIANLMLARLGQKAITSIDDPTTPVEDVVAQHFAPTRRKLLRGYVFNFSKKYAILTASETVTPAFGYSTAFALPNDFIRILALGDVTVNADTPPGLYDLSEGHIFTSQAENDGSLNIHYIKDATTVATWDALFVELMRLQGAKDMAYAFTLKPSLVTQIDAELADVKLQAAAIAGQEKPPRRIERSRLRDLRRMGGSFRDNTRI